MSKVIVWHEGYQYRLTKKAGLKLVGGDDRAPTFIKHDGTQMWMRNGKLHRDGGEPAVIYGNGTKRWYVEGIYIKSVPHEPDLVIPGRILRDEG